MKSAAPRPLMSSVAPFWTVTLVGAALNAPNDPLAVSEAAAITMPAVIVALPVKVFRPPSVNVPVPDLVRPPEPEMTPA